MSEISRPSALRQTDSRTTDLHILRIEDESVFFRYQRGIREILGHYRASLADDFTDNRPETLLANTATYIPFLWLIVGESGKAATGETGGKDVVYAIAGFSDVIPGRHAFLHGAALPAIRRHPIIDTLAAQSFETAFNKLHALKIKAEFEATNRGALGFCLRMGFKREAVFPGDTLRNGQAMDIVRYALKNPTLSA